MPATLCESHAYLNSMFDTKLFPARIPHHIMFDTHASPAPRLTISQNPPPPPCPAMGIIAAMSSAGFFAGTVSTHGGTTSLKLVNTGKTALYHQKITSPSNDNSNESGLKRNKVSHYTKASMHADSTLRQ